jgi:cytochrome c oxidase assembly protein subunit 15
MATMAPGVAAVGPVDYSNNEASPWLSVWLFLVILLVIAMVAVGGATRLTDSGLSITEWKPLLGAIPPLNAADWSDAFTKYKTIPEYKLVNDGMSLAQFKAIYWWEWGHRFLGRFIGLAYGLPLLGFWLAGRIPKRLKLPLFCVLLLGALQGFVGWYMVQSGLTERVDVSHYRLAMHLSLAFILLGCLVWLALAARQVDPLTRSQTIAAPARTIGLALVGLVMLQVVLGAFVAGTKAGLTYNTWPLMDGYIVPSGLWSHDPWYMNVFENLTTIQFNHRMLAYVLLLLATIQAFMILSQTERTSAIASAWLLCMLMYAQAGLGIWALVSVDGAIPLHLGVTHQTMAAIVFAVAVVHRFTMRRPPET